jgi:hypothetical protein
MHRNDDLALFSVMETDQTADSFTRVALDHMVTGRLISWRSQEAQEQALPNQDYAKVMCRQNSSSLCFCVCDGVGSSYKGDFASQYLASRLVSWLLELPDPRISSIKLAAMLRTYLNELVYDAQNELAALALPANIPPLVREVLEELCTDYGSETVFLCGRIDYGLYEHTRASHYAFRDPVLGRGLFCWMGNVTARLFTSPHRYILLGDRTDQQGRWSTLRGCRGRVRVWNRPLRALEHLVVHTDGFDELGEQLPYLDDDELHGQARAQLRLPANDDMTALELHWQRMAFAMDQGLQEPLR